MWIVMTTCITGRNHHDAERCEALLHRRRNREEHCPAMPDGSWDRTVRSGIRELGPSRATTLVALSRGADGVDLLAARQRDRGRRHRRRSQSRGGSEVEPNHHRREEESPSTCRCGATRPSTTWCCRWSLCPANGRRSAPRRSDHDERTRRLQSPDTTPKS
jgi:hypothetical protein